jgi:hypothetical protein
LICSPTDSSSLVNSLTTIGLALPAGTRRPPSKTWTVMIIFLGVE